MKAHNRILHVSLWLVLSLVTHTFTLAALAQSPVADAFNPAPAGSFSSVSSLAVQADGRILVGGYFTSLGGQNRTNIGRLNADGTLDTSFNLRAIDGVSTFAVQA